jgi:hypothetical protein
VIKKLLLLLLVALLASCAQTTKSTVPSQSIPSVTPSLGQTSASLPSLSKSPTLPQAPAGWHWISGVRASVAVPANYVGGSPENLKAIAAALPKAGLDSDALAALLGRYVGPTNLFAIDRSTLSKAFPTNLSVALDGNPKEKELDSYLANAVKELGSDWQVQKQEKIALGVGKNRQFARIEAKSQKSPVTAVFYITADAGKFWLLTFTTESGVFDKQQSDFEKIVSSIQY